MSNNKFTDKVEFVLR